MHKALKAWAFLLVSGFNIVFQRSSVFLFAYISKQEVRRRTFSFPGKMSFILI